MGKEKKKRNHSKQKSSKRISTAKRQSPLKKGKSVGQKRQTVERSRVIAHEELPN